MLQGPRVKKCSGTSILTRVFSPFAKRSSARPAWFHSTLRLVTSWANMPGGAIDFYAAHRSTDLRARLLWFQGLQAALARKPAPHRPSLAGVSFVPQCDYRVDSHSAPRGQITCGKRGNRENHDDRNIGEGAKRTHTK